MEKETKRGVVTLLTYVFCIPYNLGLLFGPLYVIRIILNMSGWTSTFIGFIIGLLLLVFGGLFPNPKTEKEKKALAFVNHVEKHLKQMSNQEKRHGKVMCKICMKDIDEIYEEENGSS